MTSDFYFNATSWFCKTPFKAQCPPPPLSFFLYLHHCKWIVYCFLSSFWKEIQETTRVDITRKDRRVCIYKYKVFWRNRLLQYQSLVFFYQNCSSTVRKNCSSGWEKLLKFKAKGREFAKILRSLKQFVRTKIFGV